MKPRRCRWDGPDRLVVLFESRRIATLRGAAGWLLDPGSGAAPARVAFDRLPSVVVELDQALARRLQVLGNVAPAPAQPPAAATPAPPGLPGPAELVELLRQPENAAALAEVRQLLGAEPRPFDPASLDAQQVAAVVRAHPAEAADEAATLTDNRMARRFLAKAAATYRRTGSF